MTELFVESQSTSDVGGQLQIELQAGGEGPWIPDLNTVWEAVWSVGALEDFMGNCVRAQEVGNGVDYIGNSAYSEILDLV